MDRSTLCPFGCNERVCYCEHMIGWTENGRTIEFRGPSSADTVILPTDRLVNTGVTCRVYRNSKPA